MAGWRAAAAIVVLVSAGPVIAAPCGAPTGTDGYELLDQGYRALYNLDFDRADNAFMRWEMHEPRNPLGPASRASGYLFREFERLGVLRSELFANDKSFEARSKLLPDPNAHYRGVLGDFHAGGWAASRGQSYGGRLWQEVMAGATAPGGSSVVAPDPPVEHCFDINFAQNQMA
jgi:hypothetical protein